MYYSILLFHSILFHSTACSISFCFILFCSVLSILFLFFWSYSDSKYCTPQNDRKVKHSKTKSWDIGNMFLNFVWPFFGMSQMAHSPDSPVGEWWGNDGEWISITSSCWCYWPIRTLWWGCPRSREQKAVLGENWTVHLPSTSWNIIYSRDSANYGHPWHLEVQDLLGPPRAC